MTILVGLTGGIGTGKSTVSRMLAEIGVPIVDADLVAALLMQPGAPVYNDIVTHFGHDILSANGSIDRAKLGAIVFADDNERHILEALSHSKIWAAMWEQYLTLRAAQHCAVVFEVPLLIEAKLNHLVDEVWLVVCSSETQLARVMARNFTKEQAVARINAQMPLQDKARYAQKMIDSEMPLEATRAQVQRLYDSICGGGN